ncbi:Nitroreductase [Methylocella tundrae]|uniref:Putative NAD(P)H nitroreductase n=2 Tax=Methylocella tundrae TaxID=227605 RepID=A0A4U8YVD3_METTU|nr:Nitroreductase [Methylocella tundrae]
MSVGAAGFDRRHPFYAEFSEPAMNELIEMLKTRRSAPPATLSGPAPTAQEIETLLTIAARTPDHGKLAPWRFIVFEGDARERAGAIIADVYAQANPGAGAERKAAEQTRLSLAPLVIAVVSRAAPHPKIPEWEQVLSAGAVCMNLVVATNALGFAAAWLTEWYSYNQEVLARLGVGAGEKIAGFVHIGRNDWRREDRVRPALADIVTRF